MLKLGILGGTFNPIHIGHLILAQYVFEELGLEKVVFLPTGNPPHKKRRDVESGYHRLNMINEAIKNNKGFISSDLEINRQGTTYTYDTLNEFKNMYNFDELNFIIGWDTFLDMKNWFKIEEVLKMASFVVVNRNVKKKEILVYKENFIREYGGDIKIVNIPNIDIASSEIRNRNKQGKSIEYMVTKPVHDYIIANELYRGDFI